MTEWLKGLLEWLKTSPRYFFPLAVASAIVLFLPESVIKPLGLLTLRLEGQVYLGAAFLFSSCVIVCDGFLKALAWGRRKYDKHVALRNLIRRLEKLTPNEQELLRRYLEDQTRTQHFHVEDGVVSCLVQADILYPAVRQADMFEFPFNIQSWAWEYLNEHPGLLGLKQLEKKPHPSVPADATQRRG